MPLPEKDLRARVKTRVSLLDHVKDLGNQEKWGEFFDTYSGLVYWAVQQRGLSSIDAEDLTLKVFAELARIMPGFCYDPTRGSFKGLLLEIVRRRVQDFFRQHRSPIGPCGGDTPGVLSEPEDSTQAASLQDSDLERGFEEEWRQVVVRRGLENLRRNTRLAGRQFQILEGLFVRQNSVESLARRLGVRAAAIHSAHSKWKDRLKKEVDRLKDELI